MATLEASSKMTPFGCDRIFVTVLSIPATISPPANTVPYTIPTGLEVMKIFYPGYALDAN